uniref:Movement protein TGBp3 n=1 Tax=Asparagus virus 3 TaxID=445435 RepID=A0A077CZD2_9VIRU|nr:TGB3 [Asparagus virus 3]
MPNSEPGASSSFSPLSFLFSLNGLLAISALLCVCVLIAPTPQPCQVLVTGDAVRITGCQDPSRILANLNLAPWNGVKFPIL